MARIALKCACGWNFFVPGSTQGAETPCPSCGDAVAIPGRKPGQGEAKPPGLRAAERQARQRLVALLAGLVVAIVVVVAVLLTGSGGGGQDAVDDRPSDPRSPLVDRRPTSVGRPVAPDRRPVLPDAAPPSSPSDPRAPAGPSADVQIAELRAQIRHQVWMQNVAGITAEVLRLRNHTQLYENMLLRMRDEETKIEQKVTRLAELGDRFAVESHLQAGDRIIGFSSRDLTTMRPGDAAALMAQWLSTFRANQPVEQVIALRGTQRIDLYMQFPEETKELLALSREAALAGPGSEPFSADPASIPAPPPGADTAPVPADILQGIEARFAALPAGYRQALALPERDRLERLLKSKQGTGDDHSFLRVRVLEEVLPAFEREAANFRAKAAELEAKVKEPTAVDVVHLKDGRKLEGQIVEETETQIRLKFKLGSVPVKREEIDRIVKGAGAGVEFPDRYKAAAGKLPELVKLLEWCMQKNLRTEREFVATLILTMDPVHEGARKALNLRMPATK